MKYMLVLMVCFVFGCGGSPFRYGEDAPRHTLSLFHYQGERPRAAESHNFAVFTKIDGSLVEHVCISWGPVSTEGLLKRKPGRNSSWEESVEYARAQKRVIYEIGPMEIKEELYLKAVRQAAWLGSGHVEYQALSIDVECCNCIHAILNVVGPVKSGSAWGENASWVIVKHFSPWIVGSPGRVRRVAE